MHPTTNRPGVVQEKIYAYLKSKKTGADSNELVEQVVKIKGASPDMSEKLIRTALSGDRRFTLDERQLWHIIEKNGIPISDAEFAVLSLFTVRLAEKYAIIVEISAQKFKGNKLTDHFHTFINPDPSTLAALRLSDDLEQEIRQGVPAEKGALALLRFFGDVILVGYDIHALVHQLNAILGKTQETIENQVLCLKLLTKKLIPALNQKSLDDVSLFFKLPTIDTPNTEKEVSNLVNIFARCHEMVEAQKIGTIEALLEFQYPAVKIVDFSNYAFDKAFLWSIPQAPGVYKMKYKSGKTIYVGKAKNLKDRVGSYFWNTTNCLQKIANLLNTVYTIEYEITGSELAAMLLEFQLIKQYRPLFNQQIEVHERTARYG
ncbi:MAG: GIY-YIG nuclease family protein, partial [Planctomycetota bacterium]